MVSIEDYFNDFISENGFNRKSASIVTQKDYDNLIEEYKLLAEEHKRIKTKNDELLKELDDLKDDSRKLKQLQKDNKEFLNSLLRVRADFDNYQKRIAKENDRFKACATEKIIKKLIYHYDDLNRALNMLDLIENGESMKEGFELLKKNFEKLLKEEGIEPMNCKGERFDPNKHEAMMVSLEESLPENTILEELDKGYLYNNKVLRPAKVIVNNKKSNFKNKNEEYIKKSDEIWEK